MLVVAVEEECFASNMDFPLDLRPLVLLLSPLECSSSCNISALIGVTCLFRALALFEPAKFGQVKQPTRRDIRLVDFVVC